MGHWSHSVLVFKLFYSFFQAFAQLSLPIKQAKSLGLRIDSQILDISNVDVSPLDYI